MINCDYINKIDTDEQYAYFQLKTCGGEITVKVEKSRVDQVEEDLYLLTQEHFNLSLEKYVQWVNYSGKIQCSAIKRNGERCKNSVFTGDYISPEEYKKHKNGLCHIHKNNVKESIVINDYTGITVSNDTHIISNLWIEEKVSRE